MKKIRIKLKKSYGGINNSLFQEHVTGGIGRHFRGLGGKLGVPGGPQREDAEAALRKFNALFDKPDADRTQPTRATVMEYPAQVFAGLGLEHGDELEMIGRLQAIESSVASDHDARVRAREFIVEYSQKWPTGASRAILERVQDYLNQKLANRPRFSKGQKTMRIKLRKSARMQDALLKGMTVPGCPDCQLVVLSQDESSKRVGVEGTAGALNSTGGLEGITWQAKKTIDWDAGNAPNCPKCGNGMLWLESAGNQDGGLSNVGETRLSDTKKSQAYTDTLEILSK